jgi:hypothetical protein
MRGRIVSMCRRGAPILKGAILGRSRKVLTRSSGELVRVRDDQGRELGSEVLRPGQDHAAVARSILRTKKAPNEFWSRSLH